jgi:hypothetical protein
MPQFGFYMAGVSVLYTGRIGLLVAWDPREQGPRAVDALHRRDIALYSWIGPLSTAGPSVFKMRSKSPIRLPAENCPLTLDGAPDHDYFLRFGVKPGGSGGSRIADFWFEVFEGSSRIYGVPAPGGLAKVELAENTIATGLTEYSMQDRVNFEGVVDDPLGGLNGWLLGGSVPASEIWRDLMTPNQVLNWNPLPL